MKQQDSSLISTVKDIPSAFRKYDSPWGENDICRDAFWKWESRNFNDDLLAFMSKKRKRVTDQSILECAKEVCWNAGINAAQKDFNESYDALKDKCSKLEKENKNLKQDLEMKIHRYRSIKTNYRKKIATLKKKLQKVGGPCN